MIRFYLGEEPILQQRADLFAAADADDLGYVLDHLAELVVKETHGSGGYGMLVGPHATHAEREAFAAKLKARPRRLHRAADLGALDLPDLRRIAASRRAMSICGPSCSCGKEIRIVPGGLTRVALREGSLVVNSSQGGGTKDTWVLEG